MFSGIFFTSRESRKTMHTLFVQEIWGKSRMLAATRFYSFLSFFTSFYPRCSLSWLSVSCSGLKMPFPQVRNQNIVEWDDLIHFSSKGNKTFWIFKNTNKFFILKLIVH